MIKNLKDPFCPFVLNGVVKGGYQKHQNKHCGKNHIRSNGQGAAHGPAQVSFGSEDQEYEPGNGEEYTQAVEYGIGYFFPGSLKREGGGNFK